MKTTLIKSADLKNCIAADLFEKFEHKFKKLAKKAWRNGVTMPSYSITEEFSTIKSDVTGSQIQDWMRIEVFGPVVVVPGFDFVAKIEHTDNGNVISRALGQEEVAIPENVREGKPTCDHCFTNRYRLETFLLRNQEGNFVRVGRNCLAEYLGVLDPAKLLDSMVEFGRIFEGLGEGHIQTHHNLDTFLAFVVAEVRANGWVSRKMLSEGTCEAYTTTAFNVVDTLFAISHPSKDNKVEDELLAKTEDFEVAEKVISWFFSLSDETINKSEFFQNAKVCILTDDSDNYHFAEKRAGIVAALYICWKKDMEKQAERSARVPSVKYLGQVGDKIVVKGTFDRTWISDNEFGSSTLVSIVMEDGTRAQWWQSGGFEYTSKLGTQVSLKGSIKKLDEYKGDKVTVLTRCKWLD